MNPAEKKHLRILFLGSWQFDGGAGIAMDRLSKSLIEEGHYVKIVSLDRKENTYISKLTQLLARLNRKYEFETLKNITKLQDGLYKSTNYLPLNPIFWLNYRTFDVVHLHFINSGFLGLNHILKISKRIPTVWTLHSFWPFSSPHHHFRDERLDARKNLNRPGRNTPGLLTNCLSNVDFWIVPSSFMVGKISAKRTVTIPNAIPGSHLGKISDKRENRIIFVCAGDIFDPRKGLLELLHAWVEEPKLYNNYKLQVIGPIWNHSRPEELFLEAQNKGVDFIGKLETDELQKRNLTSYATIVPSLEETFSLVIAESLVAGTPVLARKTLGPIPDFASIKHAMYPIEITSRSILQSLNAISKSNVDRTKVSEGALDLFGSAGVARAHLAVYREAISSRN